MNYKEFIVTELIAWGLTVFMVLIALAVSTVINPLAYLGLKPQVTIFNLSFINILELLIGSLLIAQFLFFHKQ